MKLFWRLHATVELHTDQTPEDAGTTMRSALGMQFHGQADGDGWQLSHRDRNLFRPALYVHLHPEGGETILTAVYRPDKTLLIFMCVWSVFVLVLSVCKDWLLLVTLPLFWLVMLIGFSVGVAAANQELMALFGAYEVGES